MRPIRVLGRQGDRVELMLGDDYHFVSTTDASMINTKRQLAMVSDRGLYKIAERIALHLGYRLEPIRS